MIELQSVAHGCSTWHNLESIPTVVFYKGKYRNLALTCVGIAQGVFKLRRAAVLRQTRRAGGLGSGAWTPSLTRLLGHIATRSKRYSKER